MGDQSAYRESRERQTDRLLAVIGVAAVLSALTLGVESFLISLGSGLASTPQDPVPSIAYDLWAISGFSFVPIIAMYIALLRTRRRNIGIGMGAVVIAAGLAFSLGELADADWNIASMQNATMVAWTVLIAPFVLGAVIVGLSLRLPD